MTERPVHSLTRDLGVGLGWTSLVSLALTLVGHYATPESGLAFLSAIIAVWTGGFGLLLGIAGRSPMAISTASVTVIFFLYSVLSMRFVY